MLMMFMFFRFYGDNAAMQPTRKWGGREGGEKMESATHAAKVGKGGREGGERAKRAARSQ